MRGFTILDLRFTMDCFQLIVDEGIYDLGFGILDLGFWIYDRTLREEWGT